MLPQYGELERQAVWEFLEAADPTEEEQWDESIYRDGAPTKTTNTRVPSSRLVSSDPLSFKFPVIMIIGQIYFYWNRDWYFIYIISTFILNSS